mmetsp:Transcript_19415/g.61770  ORF Transcript_19415/g.61770 Transcript_19415/m.61770 type:complete len:281 (-) Transcript_19415:861-1703(-)
MRAVELRVPLAELLDARVSACEHWSWVEFLVAEHVHVALVLRRHATQHGLGDGTRDVPWRPASVAHDLLERLNGVHRLAHDHGAWGAGELEVHGCRTGLDNLDVHAASRQCHLGPRHAHPLVHGEEGDVWPTLRRSVAHRRPLPAARLHLFARRQRRWAHRSSWGCALPPGVPLVLQQLPEPRHVQQEGAVQHGQVRHVRTVLRQLLWVCAHHVLRVPVPHPAPGVHGQHGHFPERREQPPLPPCPHRGCLSGGDHFPQSVGVVARAWISSGFGARALWC